MKSLRRLVFSLLVMALVSTSFGAAPSGAASTQGRMLVVPRRLAAVANVDARLGVNVDDLAASASVVFTDAMKQALPWASDRVLSVADDGNVKQLAAGQVAQTVIYPFAVYPSGDYTLLYDGSGTIEVDGRSGSMTRAQTGRAIVHVTARPGFGIRLRLTATDPRDNLRNIRLIVPGFEAAYENQPFAPEFLARLAAFNVLRFVHWSHGDRAASSATWPSRPAVSQFTQAGPNGVAWEFQIALANAVGADPWFVVPVGATNFYVTQLAALVHSRLDPRLHPMFEYADGAWRPGSPVNGYAAMAGRNFRLATDTQAAALAWYSLRSTQVFAIVGSVFGADAGRIVRVLGGSPALARTAASTIDRTILATAAAGQHADAFAVDTTGATAAALVSTRSLLAGSRLALLASGGAVSLTGVGDAATSTRSELEAWRTSGGGIFTASSLAGYFAAAGMLTRISVTMQAQLNALRNGALYAYMRSYPATHVIPRPLAAQSILAPMTFPNTYRPGGTAPAAALKRSMVHLLNSSPVIAIDAGGPAVAGTNWVADVDSSGGSVSLGTTSAIDTSNVSNAAPQKVYQTGRFGTLSYVIPGLTPSGAYTVRLHFAEYHHTAVGQRTFNVAIEGAQVLTNFDIFAAAGGEYIATVQQFNATASSSGTIAIQLTTVVDNALIGGIEIVPGTAPPPTPTPTPTPVPTAQPGGIEIDAGGPAVPGTNWVADARSSGGSVSQGTRATINRSNVSNPAPQQVYQTARFGNFSYNIPGFTPSGAYTVRLHFAEFVKVAAGQRVFNVAINGVQVLTNFDIFAAAGGNLVANIQQFNATASSGGTMTIQVTSVVDNALLGGIEIVSVTGGPTPTPIPTSTPPASGDVTTYHNDTLHTGWNPSETILTPANVGSAKFGLRQQLPVDGLVMAQPLFLANYPVNGVSRNVLIVATEHDSVYAFDADSGVILWQQSLGTAQSWVDIACNNIFPEYGITSTPVIDRATGTLYVVAATEPASNVFRTTLHALDLGTGLDKLATVNIAAAVIQSNGSALSFNDARNMQRASMLLANNSLYLGFGSHCDHGGGSISGWLMRYSTSNLAQLAAFNTVEDGVTGGAELASIWGAGFGPVADAQGNVYAVTGNGAFDASASGHNYAMSVLKFAPDLSGGVRDWFAYYEPPSTTNPKFKNDNDNDLDFGSGGAMLLPTQAGSIPNPLVAMGKSADIYLLDQANLGRYSSTNAGALQVLNSGQRDGGGLWGGPAYFNGPAGPTVYYQVQNAPLKAYHLTTGGSTPQLSVSAVGTTTSGFGGSIPVVSSNGRTAGTGVVWALRRVPHVVGANATTILDAYDASNVASHLFAANAGTWSQQQDNCFIAPLVAHGKVYAGAYKTIDVFGLAP